MISKLQKFSHKRKSGYRRRKKLITTAPLGLLQKSFIFGVLVLILWTRVLSSYNTISEVRASYPTDMGMGSIRVPHVDTQEQLAVEQANLQANLAGKTSGKLADIQRQEQMAARIRNFYTRWNAPMAAQSLYIVQVAEMYGIDPRLIPAISIVESSGGQHCFKSYNAFGWGKMGFNSYEEAIHTVTRGLATGYGTDNPYAIGPTYNPVTPEAWSGKVASLMSQI